MKRRTAIWNVNRGRGGVWGRSWAWGAGRGRRWSGSGSGVGSRGRSGVGSRGRSGVGRGSTFVALSGRGANDIILARASESDQARAGSRIAVQRSQHAVGAVAFADNSKVVTAYNFPNGDLQSGRRLFLHRWRVEHCPQIADFGRLVRAQGPWGLWRLGQRDKFIAGGGVKSHGERIDTEAIHGHAIDVKLFDSGAYESVKTVGKGNVDDCTSTDTQILDQMCLGGFGQDEADDGRDRQG
jgi:hypothetical protein